MPYLVLKSEVLNLDKEESYSVFLHSNPHTWQKDSYHQSILRELPVTHEI
jgi:hypothetical protein